MVVNNTGYIFECRRDPFGNYGVVESIDVRYKDDIKRISIVLALDSLGNLVIPSTINRSTGFKALSETHGTKEAIDALVRGSKPMYAPLGQFAILAAGSIQYNRETFKVVTTQDLNFYAVKTVIEDFEGKYPAIACDIIKTVDGINTMKITTLAYETFLSSVTKGIHAEVVDNRATFLYNLVLGGVE